MERYSMLMDKKIQFCPVSVLPKFNTTQTKPCQVILLINTDKLIIKLIWSRKDQNCRRKLRIVEGKKIV
jgi:hypothetical protein